MKKLIIEFIGTMFLVLVIGISGNPLAIGATLMVMVYMGGHISGAHYNPAVTTAVLLRGKITMNEAGKYWLAQIGGGLLGAAVAYWFKDGPTSVAIATGVDGEKMLLEAIVGEVLFTFALAMVVLNVATSEQTKGNSFYGLAIGFTVFAGAMSVGAISGGAFNPAVGFCHNLFAENWSDMWVHIVCPLVGGAVAASVYKMTNPD
ncbi:MAG: MIP/aquaporin family protein [Chitinophagales bacterium]